MIQKLPFQYKITNFGTKTNFRTKMFIIETKKIVYLNHNFERKFIVFENEIMVWIQNGYFLKQKPSILREGCQFQEKDHCSEKVIYFQKKIIFEKISIKNYAHFSIFW